MLEGRTFLSTMAMENIRSGITTVFARILVAKVWRFKRRAAARS
jgi:hypothetical protein